MLQSKHSVYEFGPFQLDPDERILTRQGELVALAPKVFETLALLLEHRGQIIEKERLIESLWPDSFVEESNLSQNIFVLRKILGDDRNGNVFIQTIPRRGYRFVAAVRVVDSAASPPPKAAAASFWDQYSPFRGLRVFEPEDAWLFFGRDAETRDLIERLARCSVVPVVGNSGSGKSSLVRAGLIPALQAGQLSAMSPAYPWKIAVLRPSAQPFDYLAEMLPKQLAPGLKLKEQTEFIADCRRKLPLGGDSLRNAISALANTSQERSFDNCHFLLVVDQFEEIFTLTTDRQTRERYIEALFSASQLQGAIPVHLVLILRADFYPHCLEYPRLSRMLQENLYNVPRMTKDRLRESIEKRLMLAEASAESGLIDLLLHDVGSEPGDLALLEHALAVLWERCKGSSRTLTNLAYAEIGGLRGALRQHADHVYEVSRDEREKSLFRKVFLGLVHLGEGAQDTRRRVLKSDLYALGTADEVEALLARLVSSRLVSTGHEREETFVEVSHEALIREWPALRNWLAESREELALERRLYQAAAEWELLGRDPGAVLQGARLAQGEEWRSRHPVAPTVGQFLQASIDRRIELEERELAQQKELRCQAEARANAETQLRVQQAAAAAQARRSALRLRWLSGALTVLLFAAGAIAWMAQRQQLVERSHALSAESSNVLSRDRGRALDLALRAWHTAQTEETRLAVAKAFPELISNYNYNDRLVTVSFFPDGQRILVAQANEGLQVRNIADGHILFTLRGTREPIEDAGVSPDGRYIVAISADQTAALWDAADGRLLHRLGVHQPQAPLSGVSVAALARFSPDGRSVITTGPNNTAHIWSTGDGRSLATLQGHSGKVLDIAFAPDGQHIATASRDNSVKIWNSTGALETTFAGHTGMVVGVEFSHRGEWIITSSWDGSARLWHSRNHNLVAVLQHDGPVQEATFSPDDRYVVTASDDHTARVWGTSDGRLLFTMQHDGPIRKAGFSLDGKYILTASNDHTVRVWNSSDGQILAFLQGHTAGIQHASFSPDGRRLLTGGDDRTVRIWSMVSSVHVFTLQGHRGPVMHAEFSPDGQRIITISNDHVARLWRTRDGSLLKSLPETKGGFAFFSPDSRRVLLAGADNIAILWGTETGAPLVRLKGHTRQLWQAAFSPDGHRVVTASGDGSAQVWSAEDGRMLFTLRGHSDEVYHAVFSPNGAEIVTASRDHTLRLWNAENGGLIAVLQGHTGPVWRAMFSPDGKRVVSASFDHTARVWSSTDGHLIAVLEGHSDLVDTARFSSDGQLVLTGSWDRTARLWDSEGRMLSTFQGHSGKVIDASFSPDDSQVLTASSDQTARLWQRDYGLVTALDGHTDQVWNAAFAPNGQLIVTASLDQMARVWRVLTITDIERTLAK